MNELQQVLLVFAIVVIAGLYFLSRSRQAAIKKDAKESSASNPSDSSAEAGQNDEIDQSHKKASKALNDLGEPHIPVSQATENRVNKLDDADVNLNQGVLSFGEEFDLPPETVNEELAEEELNKPTDKPAVKQTEVKKQAPVEEIDVQKAVQAIKRDTSATNAMGGKHHVLVVEDPGMIGDDFQGSAYEEETPSFGIPEEQVGKSPGVSSGENRESQAFVIMVMSAGQEFPMKDLNQALLGVGLTLSENSIYVKRDNMGNSIIKVANLLEPGIFPTEGLEDYATPGVALILELPASVRAPAAMHDLIMMARKISQRLQGRLYNMERHLLKESDLQSMRDAAVEYESEPL